MADPALTIPRISAKEYLEIERDATNKHEFVDGIVYAMAGAGRRHNIISGNVFATLHNRVSPPCQVFSSDMRVHVKADPVERFYYPDTHVSCSDLDKEEHFNAMPVLVVEVASPSTGGYDRTAKFESYRLLPSLQEYVLFQQAEMLVELFRKRTGWQPVKYAAADTITFESIGQTLPVALFYRGVTYPAVS